MGARHDFPPMCSRLSYRDHLGQLGMFQGITRINLTISNQNTTWRLSDCVTNLTPLPRTNDRHSHAFHRIPVDVGMSRRSCCPIISRTMTVDQPSASSLLLERGTCV